MEPRRRETKPSSSSRPQLGVIIGARKSNAINPLTITLSEPDIYYFSSRIPYKHTKIMPPYKTSTVTLAKRPEGSDVIKFDIIQEIEDKLRSHVEDIYLTVKRREFLAYIYTTRRVLAFGIPDDSPYMIKCVAITSGNRDMEQKTIFYDYEPPVKSDSGLFGPFLTAELRYIDLVIVESDPVIATSLIIDPAVCMTANLRLINSVDDEITIKNHRIKPSEETTYLYWIDKPGKYFFRVELVTATGEIIKSSLNSGWHLVVCSTYIKIEEVLEIDMQRGINLIPIVAYHFGKYALEASNNMLHNQ